MSTVAVPDSAVRALVEAAGLVLEDVYHIEVTVNPYQITIRSYLRGDDGRFYFVDGQLAQISTTLPILRPVRAKP